MTRAASLLLALSVFASLSGAMATAQDAPAPAAPAPAPATPATPAEIKAGHSTHGEVFNEGPRQAAYLMNGTGKIRFKIATQKPETQQFFDQGVGQCYGFWYFEAERSFRQMAALEHENAMAYWGMALANFENVGRGKKFIVEGEKFKGKLSEHERLHFDALANYMKHDAGKGRERGDNYSRALEKILYKYPDDIEAKAMLALQLWRNRSSGSQISSYLAIDALLSEVFAAEPMHSAHHFRIHLWDGEKTEKALASAALCGQSSPSIAHMWHMPGHIYSGLKRYEDACWQQEASARVDHAHMMRDRVLPDQIHNFAHNNEWLIRNMIFVGRGHDALDLAKNMSELPRHPKYNSANNGSNKYGRDRLFDVVKQFELWDEAIAIADTLYLEPTDNPPEQLRRTRLLGTAWFRKGNVEEGNKILEELRGKWRNELASRDRAGDEADRTARGERKNDGDREKSRNERRRPFGQRTDQLEKAIQELEGHAAVLAGNFKQGYDLLNKAGGVDRGYLALIQYHAGETEQALKASADHANSKQQETLPLAHRVALLWKAEKKDEAKAELEKLRQMSGSIDVAAAPFARLTPIAMELGIGEKWVVAKTPGSDTGVRPLLDSLGPFRWQPSPAASWTLNDAEAKPHSLAEFQGKPVVLIFYLGHGCLHCTQQLKTFGPKMKEFQDAGLNVLAISSDDDAGLKLSIENYKEPIPFTLLSNADLSIFKAYRCHDDFEKQPLHGTFIIDGAGLVRWQDISADPFMDADFVLKEAKRLLSLKPTMTVSAPSVGAQ